jgi:hypothetical protein
MKTTIQMLCCALFSCHVGPALAETELPVIPVVHVDGRWRQTFGSTCQGAGYLYEETIAPSPLSDRFAYAESDVESAQMLANELNALYANDDAWRLEIGFLATDLSRPIPRLSCVEVLFEDGPQAEQYCSPPMYKYGKPMKNGGKWIFPLAKCPGYHAWVTEAPIDDVRRQASTDLLNSVTRRLREIDPQLGISWDTKLESVSTGHGTATYKEGSVSIELMCGGGVCALVLR